MARKKDPEPTETELLTPEAVENEAAQSFLTLVRSMPADAHLKTALYRHPHQYTPQVMKRETLAPPSPAPELDTMVEEVRRRYGPGHYELYISYQDPTSKKRRMIHPTFILPPDSETPPGALPGMLPAGDAIDAAMDQLTEAADMKARAAKLAAVQSVLDPKGAPVAPAADPVATVVQIVTALKAVMPPQLDPLTALKTAKELLTPAGATDAAGTLSLLDKLGDVLARFAGDGGTGGNRGGFWEFATEALRQVGPSLPQVLDVAGQLLAQRGRIATPPIPPAVTPGAVATPPAVTPPPPPGMLPPTDASWPDILAAVDHDQTKALRLRAVLDMAFLEILLAPTEVTRVDGYDRVLDFLETHLPGFVPQLALAGPDKTFDWWLTWDPRVLSYPAAGAWVRGFVDYAKQPPAEEDSHASR